MICYLKSLDLETYMRYMFLLIDDIMYLVSTLNKFKRRRWIIFYQQKNYVSQNNLNNKSSMVLRGDILVILQYFWRIQTIEGFSLHPSTIIRRSSQIHRCSAQKSPGKIMENFALCPPPPLWINQHKIMILDLVKYTDNLTGRIKTTWKH